MADGPRFGPAGVPLAFRAVKATLTVPRPNPRHGRNKNARHPPKGT
jgi:hypothetical protein